MGNEQMLGYHLKWRNYSCLVENSLSTSQKLNIELPSNLATLLLGVNLKEMKVEYHSQQSKDINNQCHQQRNG
jgi:hypothetical protein